MNDNNEFDLDDLNETETTVNVPQKDWWEGIVDWIANHKVICCLSVIGIPILLVWLGAKLFSKTDTIEIEKLPDPTILDKYDRIPISEHSMVDYAYVLKPEYQPKE